MRADDQSLDFVAMYNLRLETTRHIQIAHINLVRAIKTLEETAHDPEIPAPLRECAGELLETIRSNIQEACALVSSATINAISTCDIAPEGTILQ